jgi:hypothetical protein
MLWFRYCVVLLHTDSSFAHPNLNKKNSITTEEGKMLELHYITAHLFRALLFAENPAIYGAYTCPFFDHPKSPGSIFVCIRALWFMVARIQKYLANPPESPPESKDFKPQEAARPYAQAIQGTPSSKSKNKTVNVHGNVTAPVANFLDQTPAEMWTKRKLRKPATREMATPRDWDIVYEFCMVKRMEIFKMDMKFKAPPKDKKGKIPHDLYSFLSKGGILLPPGMSVQLIPSATKRTFRTENSAFTDSSTFIWTPAQLSRYIWQYSDPMTANFLENLPRTWQAWAELVSKINDEPDWKPPTSTDGQRPIRLSAAPDLFYAQNAIQVLRMNFCESLEAESKKCIEKTNKRKSWTAYRLPDDLRKDASSQAPGWFTLYTQGLYPEEFPLEPSTVERLKERQRAAPEIANPSSTKKKSKRKRPVVDEEEEEEEERSLPVKKRPKPSTPAKKPSRSQPNRKAKVYTKSEEEELEEEDDGGVLTQIPGISFNVAPLAEKRRTRRSNSFSHLSPLSPASSQPSPPMDGAYDGDDEEQKERPSTSKEQEEEDEGVTPAPAVKVLGSWHLLPESVTDAVSDFGEKAENFWKPILENLGQRLNAIIVRQVYGTAARTGKGMNNQIFFDTIRFVPSESPKKNDKIRVSLEFTSKVKVKPSIWERCHVLCRQLTNKILTVDTDFRPFELLHKHIPYWTFSVYLKMATTKHDIPILFTWARASQKFHRPVVPGMCGAFKEPFPELCEELKLDQELIAENEEDEEDDDEEAVSHKAETTPFKEVCPNK